MQVLVLVTVDCYCKEVVLVHLMHLMPGCAFSETVSQCWPAVSTRCSASAAQQQQHNPQHGSETWPRPRLIVGSPRPRGGDSAPLQTALVHLLQPVKETAADWRQSHRAAQSGRTRPPFHPTVCVIQEKREHPPPSFTL